MKNYLAPLASLLLALLLALPASADPEQAVAATLDAFHGAAAEADEERYLGLMTEQAVFLGTDGSERWQGEAFRSFVHDNFSRGRGWTYRPRERRVSVAADGDIAWFDEMLDNDSLGECRGSGVLVNTASGWKIAQYNLSVPVPNALVDSVVDSIRSGETQMPAATAVAPAAAASTAAPAAQEEIEEEKQEEKKRCPIRHKTVRAADC
ncbi:hypothetical protein E4634_11360 [Mangrovimicrobium sediminis]|uniref:SnoaL-like domain-containing protein n=1 Tax=Mangrovimicrobium sediminis TaxID=2562682 RepID=A0A4Z0M2B1_9GAMM|nr:nuclear transport factor 2 family protein [Haliea sp. SAOS-164]TGD73610.1 hypothetical protein E4634_11360 [Haliea sp. SAOS-164]